MASALGRSGIKMLKKPLVTIVKDRNVSTASQWRTGGCGRLMGCFGVAVAGGVGLLFYALEQSSVEGSANAAHPPHQHWSHRGLFEAIDHASVRRGYEVYKQVCSACHSLQYIAYRNLVGVSHTEAEAKAEAEQIMVRDGPNDAGNYYERPGKLSDYFLKPYENEEAGRAANNGAYPPDLSYIVAGRKGAEDYIFSILTGYCDPPSGFMLQDGQFFNPYFDGGAISMAQVLFNGAIEYSDGTPASMSQLAKDVCTFLKWTSEPEHDQRKLLLIKVIIIFTMLISIAYYAKRFKWSSLKTRQILFVSKKKC